MNHILKPFIFLLILLPIWAHGDDERWVLRIGEETYDVTLQYNEKTILSAVYINGVVVDNGHLILQNIITIANVVTAAKENGKEVMPIGFRRNMQLSAGVEEVVVFSRGKVNIENYVKNKEDIIFQMVDKDGNRITVTVRKGKILKLVTTKSKYHFVFERKDRFDKGEGGDSSQVNYFSVDSLKSQLSLQSLRKIMLLKYDSLEIFF